LYFKERTPQPYVCVNPEELEMIPTRIFRYSWLVSPLAGECPEARVRAV